MLICAHSPAPLPPISGTKSGTSARVRRYVIGFSSRSQLWSSRSGPGSTAVSFPPGLMSSDDLFAHHRLSRPWELADDELFGPIMRGAAAAQGTPVDLTNAKSRTSLARCCLLYRRQNERGAAGDQGAALRCRIGNLRPGGTVFLLCLPARAPTLTSSR